ncbi:MAG: hypothetical protein M1814_005117 [Vezdaea aestivalis]|nr:MAG: hypothetical protein M1814_005117 [Vezdaea aestivalis]
MPSLSVNGVRAKLDELLSHAGSIKTTTTVEPILPSIDFKGSLDEIGNGTRQYAAIETASREVLQNVVITTSISEPEFVKVWNLLDILSLLGDNEQCDPALNLWLIEELLDTQTIEGCRVVFGYLESRRERLTQKHFEKRKLIILRSCNELLRRLSRAEDTVFCGRVFIFLFQSFPLGDKSSVNLRGEYHVENKTIWDETSQQKVQLPIEMDVDSNQADIRLQGGLTPLPTESQPKSNSRRGTPVPDLPEKPGSKNSSQHMPTRGKKSEPVKQPEPTLDMNTLYPIFWELQDTFSEPTKLFDASHFAKFKEGLKATINKFKEAQKQQEGRITVRQIEDPSQGNKRKRGDNGDSLHGYNPKYLTSRDLFDLEISDLAFRRHVMVQSLILIDFLLSLTTEAKAKNEDIVAPNKPILYSSSLSPEDQKWATETRSALVEQLKSGPEGPFYYRMVDTVLSRDKNWVRWKAEGCPPMQRPPVSIENWQEAFDGAKQLTANRKLRDVPLGALNIDFLEDPSMGDLNVLKDPARFKLPSVEDFERPIADDQFNIDMLSDPDGANKDEKEYLVNAKQTKIWKALRLAATDRLNLLDKVDDKAENVDALFRPIKDLDSSMSDDIEKMQDGDSQDKENRPAEDVMSDAPAIKVHSPTTEIQSSDLALKSLDKSSADPASDAVSMDIAEP